MPIRAENRARYPKDWKLRSRFVRFVRAGNRCEWCQAENGKPHPVTGGMVVLTTAHVYDHRPEACSLLNLAALCQKCHNGHDAAMRREGIKQRKKLFQGQLFEDQRAGGVEGHASEATVAENADVRPAGIKPCPAHQQRTY